MWLALLVACLDDDLPPRNCEVRRPFWPNRDGDGLGERDDVYVGCEAPPGWVATPEPLDSGTAVVPTGDTGEVVPNTAAPTADTGARAHTAALTTADTGAPAHSAAPPTGGTGAAPHSAAPTADTGAPAATGDTAGGTGP